MGVAPFNTWLISSWATDNYFHSIWNFNLCEFAHLVTTVIFFLAWDKSRVKWDNSRNSTPKWGPESKKPIKWITPMCFELMHFFRKHQISKICYFTKPLLNLVLISNSSSARIWLSVFFIKWVEIIQTTGYQRKMLKKQEKKEKERKFWKRVRLKKKESNQIKKYR